MSTKHVLVVEDDPDGQELVATILEHLNYEVVTADDGEQAAEMLFEQAATFDAVIIDLALPKMDGWELLEAILNNPNTAALPCVAITAFHNSKLREQALKAGFTAYLAKPIDGTALGRQLDALVT